MSPQIVSVEAPAALQPACQGGRQAMFLADRQKLRSPMSPIPHFKLQYISVSMQPGCRQKQKPDLHIPQSWLTFLGKARIFPDFA